MAFLCTRSGVAGLFAFALLVNCVTAVAQPVMTLSEAARRTGPDLSPAHEGETIRVWGVVAADPVVTPDYAHVVIQDDQGAGLTLFLPARRFEDVRKGHHLDVVGSLEERAGLPVLRPNKLLIVMRGAPPEPQPMSIAQLNDPVNSGRYVVTEGTVRFSGQNAGGDVMAIGSGDQSVLLFYPYTGRKREAALRRFREGDEVRATGISAQYCPLPPYDRSFELILASPQSVQLLSRSWPISPRMFVVALGAIFVLLIGWWLREQKLTRQRRVLREITALAEDVISASSMGEIGRRLEATSSDLLGAPELNLYVYNEGAEALEKVTTDRARTALTVPVDASPGSLQALAAVAFRSKSMLVVRDLHRSSLITTDVKPPFRSAIVAPMVAQSESLGVLMMLYPNKTDLNADFQLAVQHLANQVAASLKLQDQQLMKEQLLRSEKMAAAGQLVSGVAADLRVPLAKIERISGELMDEAPSKQRSGLQHIGSEAQRGLDLVDHLLSFSNMEKRAPKTLDIHALVSRLIDIRQEELRRKEIIAVVEVPLSPVEVWADQGQLEQALLTAMVHAEHAAGAATDRTMRITSRVLGTRVQIAFESAAPAQAARTDDDPGLADYFGFPVAQAIFQSHGGDLRNVSTGENVSRLELELPVLAPATAVSEPPAPEKPGRVMTALIVEPDVASQRRLVTMIGLRGHRAIPTVSAEEAAEMVQRFQFDVLFCATRLSGLNWPELYQRVRRRTGAFALLTEGYDPEAAKAFAPGEAHILPKPVEQRELDEVLGMAEVRWTVSRP